MADDTDTAERDSEQPTVPVDPAAAEAQYTREAAAARVGKSARRGKPIPSWQKEDPAGPSPDDEQPYAAFRADQDTADAGLAERARLDAVNSFYRGTIGGSGRLAEMARVVTSPEDQLNDAERI